MHRQEDASVENAAIDFLAAHRAVARGGIGLSLPDLSPEAFVQLAELERRVRMNVPRAEQFVGCSIALTQQRSTFGRMPWLPRFPTREILRPVFSVRFGLLRRPGDTSPVCAQIPIAYRPLLPLTRAVQAELAFVPPVDLSSGSRCPEYAECIPSEDPLERCRGLAGALRAASGSSGPLHSTVETLSVDALRTEIAERKPDVLIISAHGALSEDENIAGLCIGDDVLLGPNRTSTAGRHFERLSCRPAGSGRSERHRPPPSGGRRSSIGTQVPVNVARNAALVVRFLVYMQEVLAGREAHTTLLEIWHRVQTSDASSYSGSAALQGWGLSEAPSGLPVLTEFMRSRSAGRLRLPHIYADTEEVLGEIADDQGEGSEFGTGLSTGSSQSLFYLFAGRPERVYLRSPWSQAEPPGASPPL